MMPKRRLNSRRILLGRIPKPGRVRIGSKRWKPYRGKIIYKVREPINFKTKPWFKSIIGKVIIGKRRDGDLPTLKYRLRMSNLNYSKMLYSPVQGFKLARSKCRIFLKRKRK